MPQTSSGAPLVLPGEGARGRERMGREGGRRRGGRKEGRKGRLVEDKSQG